MLMHMNDQSMGQGVCHWPRQTTQRTTKRPGCHKGLCLLCGGQCLVVWKWNRWWWRARGMPLNGKQAAVRQPSPLCLSFSFPSFPLELASNSPRPSLVLFLVTSARPQLQPFFPRQLFGLCIRLCSRTHSAAFLFQECVQAREGRRRCLECCANHPPLFSTSTQEGEEQAGPRGRGHASDDSHGTCGWPRMGRGRQHQHCRASRTSGHGPGRRSQGRGGGHCPRGAKHGNAGQKLQSVVRHGCAAPSTGYLAKFGEGA